MMQIFLIILSSFVISMLLTGRVRHFVLSRDLLDRPNHRSSHSIPTPRGGGIAFVVSFLMAIFFLIYLGLVSMPVALAVLCGGTLVAVVGVIDDYKQVSAKLRFMVHFVAGAIALYCLGGMSSISILGYLIPGGIGLNRLALVYLVWLLNLYNFMDGIDGLAALEAITVCTSAVILYLIKGNLSLIVLPLTLSASVAGFLWWNFPVARIFMGDVGSGFLGLILGVLSIQAAGVSEDLFFGWLILLGVFIVDATVTLLFRLFQGEKITEAHRTHAYQHATQHFGSHWKVSLGVCMLTICWLLPLAILVTRHVLQGFIGLLIAYIPLIVMAISLKAGRSQTL